MKISISKELYSRNTLLKTCYKFTDDYYIHLSSNRDRYEIDIKLKDGDEDPELSDRFENELIEQVNREIVINETRNIREILFARAMASSVIYKEDGEGEINTDVNDYTAMKDWFDENE